MERKTVKIITLHCPLNYGAALQAYALRTYIASLGCNVEIIDYRPGYVIDKQKYTYVGNQSASRSWARRILYICCKFFTRYRVKKAFRAFLDKELCKGTPKFRSIEELERKVSQADMFICGSDQIWNTHLPNGWDEAFYLTFVKQGYKCSYAASMAISGVLTEKEKQHYVAMLAHLDAVSVREQDAKNLLQPLTKKNVFHVLDPVFLLTDNEWTNLASKGSMKLLPQQYILVYIIGNSDRELQIARLLADQVKMPVYSVTQSIRRQPLADKKISGCSPYDFLLLFHDAAYVVTNSFHGTAFSVIFKKRFWSCSVGKTSSRLTSLLTSLGLESRYIDSSKPISEIPLLDSINYTAVKPILLDNVSKSREYLNNCIMNS